MILAPNQYMVLEAVLAQATVPVTESDKYINLLAAMRSARQKDDSNVEIEIDHEDLKLFHPFLLDSDFKLRDLEFVIDLIHLLGMTFLTEPSIEKYKGVTMLTNFKYTGKEALSIVYGGIATTICPGDLVKSYFLPHLKKRYPECLTNMDQSPVVEEVKIVEEVIIPKGHHDVEDFYPEDEEIFTDELAIPTPILNQEQIDARYPYKFKEHNIVNTESLKMLYKEELQVLAIELGLPSNGKKNELMKRVNKLLIQ